MDVSDVADVCSSAVVRYGGVCAGFDSYGRRVSRLPKNHFKRYCSAEYEVELMFECWNV
jgi:hypothetical protein